MNATFTPTFRTGTSFVLNGKVCRVVRGHRVNVSYVTEHSTNRDEDTMHVAKRATLVGFLNAGLIMPV